MKKIIYSVIIILLIVVTAIYISLNYGDKKQAISVLIDIDNVNDFNFKAHDSVLVAASFIYDANSFKNFMQGEHYRDAWSTPIKVPIVFLDTLHGGSEIVDVGGGKQTKSLELKAGNGFIYTLRSINKNPKPLIPEFVEILGLENIIIDGISAQHPYGAIPVAHLAESVGLLHTNPKIVFLPKQEQLAEYNAEFGNKLFLLEYENKNKSNWTNFKNVTEIIDTDHLIELKNEKGDTLKIDEALLVKNRLFDLVIGDWDRHAKQWGWVIVKEENNLKAIPLGVDRDNTFFNIDGIIPSIISNPNITKELRSFENSIEHMSGLVQPFDCYFLIKTDSSIFIEQAKILKDELTDDIIDGALNTWPKDIRELDGEIIREKIISRRDSIVKHAINFKQTIDKSGKFENWPLKGCDDLKIKDSLKICFECL